MKKIKSFIKTIDFMDNLMDKRHVIMFVVFSFILEMTAMVLTKNSFLPASYWLFVIYVFGLVGLSFYYGGRAAQFLLGIPLIFHFLINGSAIILFETSGLVYERHLYGVFLENASLENITFNLAYLFFGITAIIFYFSVSLFGKPPYVPYVKKSIGSVLFTFRNIVITAVAFALYLFAVSAIAPGVSYDYEDHLEGYTTPSYEHIGVLPRHFQQWLMYSEKPNQFEDGAFFEFLSYKTIEEVPLESSNVFLLDVPHLEWFLLTDNHRTNNTSLSLGDENRELLLPNLMFLLNNSKIFTNFYTTDSTKNSTTNVFLGNRTPFQKHETFFRDFNYNNTLVNFLEGNDKSLSLSFESSKGEHRSFLNILGKTNFETQELSQINFEKNFIYHKTNVLKQDLSAPTEGLGYYFAVLDEILGDDVDWTSHRTRLEIRRHLAYAMVFDEMLGEILNDMPEDFVLILYSSEQNQSYSGFLARDNKRALFNVPLLVYHPNQTTHVVYENFKTEYALTTTILEMFEIDYKQALFYSESLFSEKSDPIYSPFLKAYFFKGHFFINMQDFRFFEVIQEFPNAREKMFELSNKQAFVDQYYFYFGGSDD